MTTIRMEFKFLKAIAYRKARSLKFVPQAKILIIDHMGRFSNFVCRIIKPNFQSNTELKFIKSMFAKNKLISNRQRIFFVYRITIRTQIISYSVACLQKLASRILSALPKFDSWSSMSFKYQKSQLCKTMIICALRF